MPAVDFIDFYLHIIIVLDLVHLILYKEQASLTTKYRAGIALVFPLPMETLNSSSPISANLIDLIQQLRCLA